MCNFIDDIPSKTGSIESKKRFINLILQPTNGDLYRFRLIGFSTKTRENPFIERYVHEHWGTNADGKRFMEDQVVCPKSPFIGERECPICAHATKLYVSYKNSGWTDKISAAKKREIGRQYKAHVLVYVVKDPNYQGNVGKLKVITFNNPDDYKMFLEKARTTRRSGLKIFNDSNAVDFWVKVDRVEEVFGEGTAKEYHKTSNKIVDMGFSTKPYDIKAIQPKLIDDFPYDEEYYRISTQKEITDYYKKYCTGIGIDVPDDDIVPTSTHTQKKDSPTSNKTIKKAVSENVKDTERPTEDVDISSIVGDLDAEERQQPENDIDVGGLESDPDDVNLDLDDILNDL